MIPDFCQEAKAKNTAALLSLWIEKPLFFMVFYGFDAGILRKSPVENFGIPFHGASLFQPVFYFLLRFLSR